MGKIVRLKSKGKPPGHRDSQARKSAPAQVLLFTGVHYSRGPAVRPDTLGRPPRRRNG